MLGVARRDTRMLTQLLGPLPADLMTSSSVQVSGRSRGVGLPFS